MRKWLMQIVGKVRRWEVLLSILLALIWVPILVIYPLATLHEGTARDISYEIIAEPYADSPVLTYRWHGDVYRSCDISLRRSIVDSTGQVHSLVNSPVLQAVPRDELGMQDFLVDVRIGPNLAEGPAIYYVREVPRCTWMQRVWPVSVPYPPLHFTVTRVD